MKIYSIFWKSKITGNSGNGTTKFTEDQAKIIADEMNKLYPDIVHWYEIAN